MYPLSKQEVFVADVVRLDQVADEVGAAYGALRKWISPHVPLNGKQRQLGLLPGLAASRARTAHPRA